MQKTNKRNWSHYNQYLKRQASIALYISEDVVQKGAYCGPRKPGGIIRYSDTLIEACLLLREYFGLGLRQTQGFVASIITQLGATFNAPDYTTLCRRGRALSIDLKAHLPRLRQGYVIAVDSTGLSLIARDSWNRHKHGKRTTRGHQTWHKLHVSVATETGEIVAAQDSPANANDCQFLPMLIESIETDQVSAVAADMAYDSRQCRKAIMDKGARQLIPPKRDACLSRNNRNMARHKEALRERDAAIGYIKANAVNGDDRLARKQWKNLSGYHRRSLVETTMSRLKAHTKTHITNKRADSIAVQCRLKCKLLNILNQA